MEKQDKNYLFLNRIYQHKNNGRITSKEFESFNPEIIEDLKLKVWDVVLGMTELKFEHVHPWKQQVPKTNLS